MGRLGNWVVDDGAISSGAVLPGEARSFRWQNGLLCALPAPNSQASPRARPVKRETRRV